MQTGCTDVDVNIILYMYHYVFRVSVTPVRLPARTHNATVEESAITFYPRECVMQTSCAYVDVSGCM